MNQKNPTLIQQGKHSVIRQDDVLPANSWLRKLAPGDCVWWNDPDHDILSNAYKVSRITGEVVDAVDTVVHLKNDVGSEAEVFASELSPSMPEGTFPVVDSNGSIGGWSISRGNAIAIGFANLSGDTVDAHLAENVALVGGQTVAQAWVATSTPVPETRCVRLTLDVTYTLNGEDLATMSARLHNMVERAIGGGLLTGETDAEVEQYSMDTAVMPESITEDQLANFMLERIESGDFALKDLPVRLARYGLMEMPAFVAEMRERLVHQVEG